MHFAGLYCEACHVKHFGRPEQAPQAERFGPPDGVFASESEDAPQAEATPPERFADMAKRAGEALADAPPMLAASTIDERRGLYRKYDVRRLSDPAGKHHDCTYFVIDERHDKFAGPALRAYADACEVEFPELAADLRMRHQVTTNSDPRGPDGVIRAAEGVTLEPGEYVDASDESVRLSTPILMSVSAVSDLGRWVFPFGRLRRDWVTAVRRVAPESAAKPPAELYVPKKDERVRVVEVAPWDDSPDLIVGDVLIASDSCFAGDGAAEGGARFAGWVMVTPKTQAGTWCRVVPAPLTEPEPVPESGGEPCPCNHASDPTMPHERCCPAALKTALDAAGQFISAASDGGEYPNRVLAGLEIVRVALAVREMEGNGCCEANANYVEELARVRGELAEVHASVTDNPQFNAMHQENERLWELYKARDGELKAEQYHLTLLHCAVANAWSRYLDKDDVKAFVLEVENIARRNPRLGPVPPDPTETPDVAAPAVVQGEIVVGSTWADTHGVYADGKVTSYNPQLPDTIRITGASSWSEPVFRRRWRHVSDPPAPPTAIPRGTTLEVGSWYRITEIAASDDTPHHKVGDVLQCFGGVSVLPNGSIYAAPNYRREWSAKAGACQFTYVTGLELVPGPVKEQA